MADEQKVFSILKEAKKQDLVKPSELTNICFVSYINTANHILLEISKAPKKSITTEGIIKGTGLNGNTCKIYLRVLEKLNFIHKTKIKDSKMNVWKLNP